MDRWQPLVKEDSDEPIIVMCPEGGELRCYFDGTVAIHEGSKMWQLRLPPGVAIYHDTSMPLAVADRASVAEVKGLIDGLGVTAAIRVLERHGFAWQRATARGALYGSIWERDSDIITVLLDGSRVKTWEAG